MHAIEISGLVKTYSNGTRALKGVDLVLEKGDFFALLGANGAGKTTMINVITTLVKKTEGQVKIFGHDIDQNPVSAKLSIGVVPQEFNFSIFEKVIDIVVTQAGYYGIEKKEAVKRAEKLLTDLDLWEKKDMQSMKLSGGMKRRLMIARALVNNPNILILDEPTAGVDVELRRSMWDYLKKINGEGKTILLTTHYLEEAEQLCNKVAIIKEGEIIKNQSVKSLLSTMEKHQVILSVEGEDSLMKSWDDKKGEKFEIKKIDDLTLEATMKNSDSVTELVQYLADRKVKVLDLRPKTNRLEQLYLDLLKK